MPDLEDFAMRMLQSNPQIANNPNAQQMVNAIRNHDSTAGQQIASKSQANQNSYLLQQLRPCPIPAYTVPNPCAAPCYSTYQSCGC